VTAMTGDEAGDAMVELRTPAGAAWAATARRVASEVAIQAGFDLDHISDFRMAVDEACVELIRLRDRTGVLRCLFTIGQDELRAVVGLRPAPSRPRVDTGRFGWRVLCTLVDELSTGLAECGGELLIELVLRKRAEPASAPGRSTDSPGARRSGLRKSNA